MSQMPTDNADLIAALSESTRASTELVRAIGELRATLVQHREQQIIDRVTARAESSVGGRGNEQLADVARQILTSVTSIDQTVKAQVVR